VVHGSTWTIGTKIYVPCRGLRSSADQGHQMRQRWTLPTDTISDTVLGLPPPLSTLMTGLLHRVWRLCRRVALSATRLMRRKGLLRR
jgi:hypothetical protein